MGATRGEAGTAVLAYQVEVTNDDNVRDVVFLDAQTGKPLNRWSMVHDALDRELYEKRHRARPTWCGRRATRSPGTLNADQQNLVDSTGESYWLFKNAFGRDSYDGDGRHDEHGQQRPADQLPQRQLERRRPPTTATASPPTTSSPTSGATPTPSTPPA